MTYSLSNLIFQKCNLYSSLSALKVKDEVVSYSELNESALQISGFLNQIGIKNETICIVGSRTKGTYIGILSILYAGCNYTPLNDKISNARIISTIEDTDSRVFIGDYVQLKHIYDLLSIQNISLSKYIFVALDIIDNLDKENWFNYSEILNYKILEKPVGSDLNQLAYILFTSGSTGKAKGVMVSNKNILAYLESIKMTWNLPPGFRASQTHDLTFDPSVSDIFNTWNNGGLLCIPSEKDILMPIDFINNEKLDIWSSVPTIANFLYKMGFLKDGVFMNLKISRFAGEPFSILLADAWQKAAPYSTVENHYGPTEATIDVTRFVYKPNSNLEFANSTLPIGKPLPGNNVKIIDENGSIVQDNKIGQIVFKGRQITKGYLNDSDKTSKSFVKFSWDIDNEIWYKSGDLGFINLDGDIECIGRIDSQIKIGGKRVEAGEIESFFRQETRIKDLIVVPVKDAANITQYCVGFTTYDFLKDEERFFKESSKKYFENIFYPKQIIIIDKFPLTISGKINRNELVELVKNKLR